MNWLQISWEFINVLFSVHKIASCKGGVISLTLSNLQIISLIPQMIVVPTGVQATGAIGTVSISLSAVATVTGVSASLTTTNVLVWSEIDTNQNPNWVEIAA